MYRCFANAHRSASGLRVEAPKGRAPGIRAGSRMKSSEIVFSAERIVIILLKLMETIDLTYEA